MNCNPKSQRRRTWRSLVLGLFASATLVLAGCSTVSTNSDQKALHYKAGAISATAYSDCVPSNTRNVDGASDIHYYYPDGQRTFDFTGGKDADSEPYSVASKDNQEFKVSGGLTFNLDTSCDGTGDNAGGMLRKFHESIGLKHQPIMDEDGTTGDGWNKLLKFYMGQPLNKALTTEAQRYPWLSLYNDPATRVKFEQAVNEQLKTAITATTGGNAYFLNFNLTLQKPQVNPALVAALAKVEVAITERKAVAEENLTVAAKLEQIKSLVKVMGPYGYVIYDAMQQCLQGKEVPAGCPEFLVVPAGTNVNIPQGK